MGGVKRCVARTARSMTSATLSGCVLTGLVISARLNDLYAFFQKTQDVLDRCLHYVAGGIC